MLNKKLIVQKLMTEHNITLLKEAILSAEKETSGEIRVHLEDYIPHKQSVDQRAKEIFFKLEMDKTKDANGILIYIAYLDRQFVILGDKGIDQKVGLNFWQAEKDEMTKSFKEGLFIEGIVNFIYHIGYKLKEFFPYHSDDINELSDEISIGKNEIKE